MRGLRTKKNKKRNLRGGARSSEKKWTNDKTKCFFKMLDRYYYVYWNESYEHIKLALDEVIKKNGVKNYLTANYSDIEESAEETRWFLERNLVDWEIIESFSWVNSKTGEEIRFSNSDLENFIKHRDKAMDLFNEAYMFLQNKVGKKICLTKRHSPRARSAKVGQVAKTSMRLAGKEIIKSFRNLFGMRKK